VEARLYLSLVITGGHAAINPNNLLHINLA